ncbi:type 4a pilus biogenesis protein PilO [Desulfoglaeba alkanexedens]|jgi:type IV pilus assembly protein PilO|nr:type 4a pilus biogenesis protein PilO [Desulfoglaeba alkanexedens]
MEFKVNPIAAVEGRLSELTNLQRILVFVVMVGVLAGAFYFFKYKPQAQTLRRLTAGIHEHERRLAALQRIAQEVKVFEAEVKKSQEEFEQLLVLLPDRKEIPELLETVSRIGAQDGLENILFQPQAEQTHQFHATIPIRLDLAGGFHQLATFLDKISRLDRIIQVDTLTLNRRDDSSLQVNCVLKTFRFLEEQERPKPAAPNKKR